MNKFLRYPLFCLLGLLTLAGCKSIDPVLFKSSADALPKRLPTLDVSVDNGPLALTEGALPEDAMKLFEQEATQNLMEPMDSVKFGYVRLLVTSANTRRKGKGLQAFQMITFMTPSLLGLPLEYYSTNVKAEVQVMNAQGEIIGSYTGQGTSNVRVAMYYGYSQTSAGRLADVEALRQALNEIRPQLAGASDSLRARLLATGPVEEIIGQAAADQ